MDASPFSLLPFDASPGLPLSVAASLGSSHPSLRLGLCFDAPDLDCGELALAVRRFGCPHRLDSTRPAWRIVWRLGRAGGRLGIWRSGILRVEALGRAGQSLLGRAQMLLANHREPGEHVFQLLLGVGVVDLEVALIVENAA